MEQCENCHEDINNAEYMCVNCGRWCIMSHGVTVCVLIHKNSQSVYCHGLYDIDGPYTATSRI